MYKIKDVLNVLILALKAKIGSDVLTIPEGLGNNILVTNSSIVTHQGISMMLKVTLFGTEVPYNIFQIINNEFTRYGVNCVLDFTIKSIPTDFSNKRVMDDVKINIGAWNNVINGQITNGNVENAKWALRSVDQLTTGNAYSMHCYIKITARDGNTLNKALSIVKTVLQKSKSIFYTGTYSLKSLLNESSILSLDSSTGYSIPGTADLIPKVAVEPFPKSNGGTVFGQDIRTNEPYTIDFTKESFARNILVIAPSGSGKTFTLLSIAQSALESGSNAVFIDIKGNEYKTLTESVGGYVIDLSDKSSTCIDCVVRRKDNCTDYQEYFQRMDRLLLDILVTLSAKDLSKQTVQILNSCIKSMWYKLGVVDTNEDTWVKTEAMTIYDVYNYLYNYCYKQFDVKEQAELFEALESISLYLGSNTAYKNLFANPLSLQDIYDKRAISFAFNILVGKSTDETLFKLRWLFMDEIMTQYTYHNYKSGKRTFKIMEEAQIVASDVMKVYCTQWTLGRSLMQDNIFIANSFNTIADREDAKPIIENATILMTAALQSETKEKFIKSFELESYRPLLDTIEKPGYAHTFFIYTMSRLTPPSIIRALFTGEKPKISIPT